LPRDGALVGGEGIASLVSGEWEGAEAACQGVFARPLWANAPSPSPSISSTSTSCRIVPTGPRRRHAVRTAWTRMSPPPCLRTTEVRLTYHIFLSFFECLSKGTTQRSINGFTFKPDYKGAARAAASTTSGRTKPRSSCTRKPRAGHSRECQVLEVRCPCPLALTWTRRLCLCFPSSNILSHSRRRRVRARAAQKHGGPWILEGNSARTWAWPLSWRHVRGTEIWAQYRMTRIQALSLLFCLFHQGMAMALYPKPLNSGRYTLNTVPRNLSLDQ